ncbi:hypothetical protein C7271_22645 [filamentous cyanobacterium CCP5]|nr:hypothetical protein C7271_22645 [filamentous cyanobacterium CCP5]
MSPILAAVSVSPQVQKTSITIDDVLGIAIFDASGLPQEYFVTPGNKTTQWVQVVFQALGLKPLLMSSLGLDGFHHGSAILADNTAVVVRGKRTYIAMLLKGQHVFRNLEEAEQFSQWSRQFEQTTLRQDSRFKPV